MRIESSCIADSRFDALETRGSQRVESHGRASSLGDRNGGDSIPKAARLRPKEHGAYAILAIPLVAALFIAGLTPATVLIATAAIAAFLAHEPLLIVAGNRGNRARESTPAAARALTVQVVVVVVCGASAFWLGGLTVRLGLIACIVFASVELFVSINGYNRTLAAQLLGIAGLTLPSAVAVIAGGAELIVATQFWLIWFAGRIATTVSVRSAITHHKSSASILATRIYDILLAIAFAVCCVGLFRGDEIWIVTVPLLLAAGMLRVVSPHPRHLKQVGWSLLVVNIISGVIAIAVWNY